MQVQRMFGVNAEAASTGLTVYVLGFAFGPLLCMQHILLSIIVHTDSLFFVMQGQVLLLKSDFYMTLILGLGPMSELFGRRLPYMISWPLLVGESNIPES